MRACPSSAASCSLALLIVFGGCAQPGHGGVPRPAGVEAFDWLTGCWETEIGQTREVWTREGPNLLFGHNVVRRDGAVVFFEQLRLEQREGGWVFSAYPRGVGPTEFTLAAPELSSARFENPYHDFPQVIAYERMGDRLTAQASGLEGSNPQQWDYAPCVEH